ncbi:hypothetical protein Busp01_01470 [Trinickia caryophylli]|nr:hypothetical protein Busp01_01470 [Trinickia caryophylli]
MQQRWPKRILRVVRRHSYPLPEKIVEDMDQFVEEHRGVGFQAIGRGNTRTLRDREIAMQFRTRSFTVVRIFLNVRDNAK